MSKAEPYGAQDSVVRVALPRCNLSCALPLRCRFSEVCFLNPQCYRSGMIRLPRVLFCPLLVAALVLDALANDEPPEKSSSTNAVEAGHSLHGEAFNEGPRQAARLIPGTGKV